MEKETSYRSISNIEADCAEGLLFCGWTTKWGVKVYPWYEKDMITFSFIEKGKQGKGKSFDVSVPAKKNYAFDFTDFTHEILHDIPTPFDFVTMMKQEKANSEIYPKRYKFVSGADGEKMVGFCNSNSDGREYCLNASTINDKKKIIVNMPLSYYDIYELAAAFSETYREREEELRQIRKDGITARGERIKSFAAKPFSNLTVTTKGEIKEISDGEYAVTALTKQRSSKHTPENGSEEDEICIRFTKKAIQDMSKGRVDCFDQLCQMAAQKPTNFCFSGKIMCRDGKDEYIFEQFATKN